MKKIRCDVLVMIWGMVGRDPQALIPVIFLLKEKFKLTVEVRSIFDYTAIDKLKPKLLLTNGCSGSRETYKVTKYAKNRGIHVVSLHAEGMFTKERIKEYLWGHNKEEIATVDKWFLWSDRALRYTLKYSPSLKDVVESVGATGFEKYLFFNKTLFKNENLIPLNYESIILYNAWGFDIIKTQVDSKKQIAAEKYKNYVVECLKKIATNFPNKLLILKYHPATINPQETEISNYFDDYNNILIMKNELPIYKLILLCDIMISFESSTTIDAWLSDKPTFNLYDGKTPIYPDSSTGIDDIRDGSIVPNSSEELINIMHEYFKFGKITDFDKKSDLRKEIINQNIGDIKSKPSLKVANYIYKNLNKSIYPKGNINLNLYLKGILNRIIYNKKFLPSIPKMNNMRRYYKPNLFEAQYKEFHTYLNKYYNVITHD